MEATVWRMHHPNTSRLVAVQPTKLLMCLLNTLRLVAMINYSLQNRGKWFVITVES